MKRRFVILCRKLKEERGSAIIEASVIMPIMILSIITSMVVLIYFVSFTFEEITANEYLIYKEGLEGQRRYLKYDKKSFEYDIKNNPTNKVFEINLKKGIEKGLLKNYLERESNLKRYSIDEKRLILYKDMFNEAIQR